MNAGNSSPTRSQIVVIGMHRSGTSAVARLLNGIGCFVGAPDEMIATNNENPVGFYERTDCRHACDFVLHSVGAEWWKVADFSLQAVPQDKLNEAMRQFGAIVETLDLHGNWTLKEPRLSLMLPILLSKLTHPIVVIVARNPLEVAKSLRNRNGFPHLVGLALWERYMVSALTLSAATPRILVNYDRMIEDPTAGAETLRHGLAQMGVVGLADPPDSALPRANLRRQVVKCSTDEILSASQLSLWHALCLKGTFPQRILEPDKAVDLLLRDFEQDYADMLANEKTWREEMRIMRAETSHTKAQLGSVSRLLEIRSLRVSQLSLRLNQMLSASAEAIQALDGEIKKLGERRITSYVRIGRPKEARKHLKHVRQILRVGRDFDKDP